MERAPASVLEVPAVHVILARRKKPSTSEFQLLFQRRSTNAKTDAGTWSFPGEYLSGHDMGNIPWENHPEMAKKLFVIAEKGAIEDLGKRPAGMNVTRSQPLFQPGQKLFFHNGQRPCFLYVLDDAVDVDFLKYTPRARESKRVAVDESFNEESARNGYAWIDVKDVYRDLGANTKSFANWVKELLLGMSESVLMWRLTQPSPDRSHGMSSNNRSHGFQADVMHGGAEMVGAQHMMMNGGGYEGSPIPYVDPMYLQYPQQPQVYFYPQQQQQYGYGQGRGQLNLKFRFPAHVISLDVRTTGVRLYKDKIISIGAALVSVEASNFEPRVLTHRQFDFIVQPTDFEDEPPADYFATQKEAKPESEAIKAFHDFFTEICQKHPDVYVASENPVLEVGIIDITAGRILPEKDFTSIMHATAFQQRQVDRARRNSRRDPVDLQSFACGLLKTDCNPIPSPSGSGNRWSTLKEYLEWYPSMSGISPGIRSDVEDRFPFPPRTHPSTPQVDAANKGWMFLQCLCILANRFETTPAMQPFTPYNPPMMVGGALPVQFAPQPYPPMLWQQQQQQQQQQQYFQQQQMQQMQQHMQPGGRPVAQHGHRTQKHYNYPPNAGGGGYAPHHVARNAQPMNSGGGAARAKGPNVDSAKAQDDSSQVKEQPVEGQRAPPPAVADSHLTPIMDSPTAQREQLAEAAVKPSTAQSASPPRSTTLTQSPPQQTRPPVQPAGQPAPPNVKGPVSSAGPAAAASSTEEAQAASVLPKTQTAPTAAPAPSLDSAQGQGVSPIVDSGIPSEKRAWNTVVKVLPPQHQGGIHPQQAILPQQPPRQPAPPGVLVTPHVQPSATIMLPSGVEVENPAALTQEGQPRPGAPDVAREEGQRREGGVGWSAEGSDHRSGGRGGRGGYRGGGPPRDGVGRGHRGGGGPRDAMGGLAGPSTPRGDHHQRGGGEVRNLGRGGPRGGGPGMGGRGRGTQPAPG